jgi:hypothetical protein
MAPKPSIKIDFDKEYIIKYPDKMQRQIFVPLTMANNYCIGDLIIRKGGRIITVNYMVKPEHLEEK